ncbi:hypothetical protein GCM10008022_10310 [Paenibacillus hunanensis]|nr:hypothetical protein GCM10008022_10310 [Paenibacillus hunanensis]
MLACWRFAATTPGREDTNDLRLSRDTLIVIKQAYPGLKVGLLVLFSTFRSVRMDLYERRYVNL